MFLEKKKKKKGVVTANGIRAVSFKVVRKSGKWKCRVVSEFKCNKEP
jgi:hypothetical protein